MTKVVTNITNMNPCFILVHRVVMKSDSYGSQSRCDEIRSCEAACKPLNHSRAV